MTSFNDWLELPNTEKVFLITSEAAKVQAGFTLVSGQANTYEVDFDYEITGVQEDGTAYTTRTSIATVEANQSSFWYDFATTTLYVHTSDSTDPSNFTIVVIHTIRISNHARKPFSGRYYEPRVAGFPSFKRYMQHVFFGSSAISFGNLEILNEDGFYDYLLDYVFAGWNMLIKLGGPVIGDGNYTNVLEGIQEKVPEMTRSRIKIPVRDRARVLKKKIPTTFLAAGANVPDESVNKSIPLCFGTCYNVTPLFTNDNTDEYQVHTGQIQDVLAVYDDGTALGFPADYTKDLNNGKFTLTNPASGLVTADIEGCYDGVTFYEKAGQIIKWILDNIMSWSGTDYDSTALTDLDTDRPYELGLYIDSQETIINVFDRICESVLATWGFTRANLFTVGATMAPGASADVTFYDEDFVKFAVTKSQVPEVLYRIFLTYQRDWTERDDTLSKTLISKTEDLSVLYEYPIAIEKRVDSLILQSADASTIGSAYLAFFDSQVKLLKFTAKGKPFRVSFLEDVKVESTRYSIDAYYRVIGIKEDYTRNEVELLCYGG